MVQQVNALTALVKNLGPVPSTHKAAQTAVTGNVMPLLRFTNSYAHMLHTYTFRNVPTCTCTNTCTHTHTHTRTHTHTHQNFKKPHNLENCKL